MGLLAYSPLAGGVLSGKYLDANSAGAKRSRLNLFPGYMERYNASLAKVWLNTTTNHSELKFISLPLF